MKQYVLVEHTEVFINAMRDQEYHPMMKENTFIFFGEIPNMPGYCVVSGHESGRVFSGFHLEDFQEIRNEGY